MTTSRSILARALTLALATAAGQLVAVAPAHATNAFAQAWRDAYPGSASDAADCALCHGTSTSNLNGYGRDLCLSFGGSVPADVTPNLRAVEALDSDGDPGLFPNLTEIEANAQPGWTAGENALYQTLDGGCAPTGASVAPGSGVPLPYDPPTGGDPVAVPGGPYAGSVGVPLTFDGSGSYDSDGGAMVSWEWDFGDGAAASGAIVQHAYAVAGAYTVTLTVTDDEGASTVQTTTATIAAEALLDLDVAAFKVTSSARVGRAIAVQLSVENPGPVLGQALATVVGRRDGGVVYQWSLNVYDYDGKGTTAFTFPSYTATVAGTIAWTATIADADPDVDAAGATTLVR